MHIPVLLVVTHCENVDDDWLARNQSNFDKNEMHFKEILTTCFAKGKNAGLEQVYKNLREESVESVWKAIKMYASEKPVDYVTEGGGVWALFKRLMARLFGTTPIHKRVYKILIRLGVSEEKAKTLANNFDN
eukprot:Phypoly_transcript_24014.p1 GENE.Phypoly_transcript_24014~~Phypoly_transcript_24014.p1  ORF type:complete len:132 (-),score=17.94 Phypoly_transcript_24014:67-462(-)